VSNELHRLIESGAPQGVINDRIAGLIQTLIVASSDHEKRLRYIERTVSLSLGGAAVVYFLLQVWAHR
jgi:hypothetical protein